MSDQPDVDTPTLPLVAIGASAGGLKPLEHFFTTVPEHPGIAYVVIQHLSPDYRSMMSELLARKSPLRIVHIADGLKLEPDTVYLNSPGQFAELEGDTFRTQIYLDSDGLPHLPIDRFFSSLVKRDPSKTVAMVLSGSGSDGAKGAFELHAIGAAVLAQKPQEASFSSMPRAVLMAGAVDRVLEVADMQPMIEDILREGKASVLPDDKDAGHAMARILRRLEAQYKVDFEAYKVASVHRRIIRRLHLRALPDLDTYDDLLASDASALDELFEDMLINVTEFYRDREAIRSLRSLVLNKLAEEQDSASTPLKIWVPACATGEEVYTIAIELNEALAAMGQSQTFRIIGTDVHARSIEVASRGVYSAESLAPMPESLRKRYFERVGEQYLVNPVLRQKIIFSQHNLINDPPFMNLDLVSCRNLLIYLKEEAQASAVSMFLFGLKNEGTLFLGASESIGKFSNGFDVIEPRWRIFRKKPGNRRTIGAMLSRRDPIGSSTYGQSDNAFRPTEPYRKPFLGEMRDIRSREGMMRAYDALLKRYAPSSILITNEGKVLTWFGAAAKVIDTMNNLADWTVQDIVHHDLHFPITVGLEKIRQGHVLRHERSVALTLENGEPQEVQVIVEALSENVGRSLILVRIDLQDPPTDEVKTSELGVPRVSVEGDATLLSRRIRALERDLRETEETLQHATERLEASGEELQASNEELQASNEELQASNEELQSSNEELHAVNEELVSLSAEHERKIELLSELGENTEIVLRMLGTGIIILDAERNIRRFSQLIARDFLLQDHDLGRPIKTVGPRLDFADLNVLADAFEKDDTPQTRSGKHEGRDLTVEARRIPAVGTQAANDLIFLFRWT